MEPQEVLRRAMRAYKSDDLERAAAAFNGLSDSALDEEYGQGGSTCREIWDGYARQRQDWVAAKTYLERLLLQDTS